MTTLSDQDKVFLTAMQRNEITEHHIYRKLASIEHSAENRKVLERIAAEELAHHDVWQRLTGAKVEPDGWRIFIVPLMARILGLTFTIKLMERGEAGAEKAYAALSGRVPEVDKIRQDEGDHEQALIGMLDEERLRYVGSIVLGLNDALVELTGALAGFTLALGDPRLIALTGTVTGVAAAFSMAASEYISTSTEDSDQHPLKASLYTGTAYIITVAILIAPFLVLDRVFVSLGISLCSAVVIIAAFNYYISVAKDLPFRRRFLEMTGLSLGVAALSFGLGALLRYLFGIEV